MILCNFDVTSRAGVGRLISAEATEALHRDHPAAVRSLQALAVCSALDTHKVALGVDVGAQQKANPHQLV
jgi:hypothetical protein